MVEYRIETVAINLSTLLKETYSQNDWTIVWMSIGFVHFCPSCLKPVKTSRVSQFPINISKTEYLLDNIHKFSYLTGNMLHLHFKHQPDIPVRKQSLFIMRAIRNIQIHCVGRRQSFGIFKNVVFIVITRLWAVNILQDYMIAFTLYRSRNPKLELRKLPQNTNNHKTRYYLVNACSCLVAWCIRN
jgi:hypothetical protein